ncbi:MAG: NUDIX domain-containing protein [Candidatus Beckwithbacteria bacterium]|nr:NUDIX domain-containing protein [Patescibacteria group bacterium]
MKQTIQKSKREFSAGGVVYLGDKWLVCKHSGYHKWGLPKGLVEKGESLEDTALREVEEECGIKCKIVEKITVPERYVYVFDGVKVFKQVNYFLMEYVSGDIKDHDWEVEEVEWLGFDEALTRLDFPGAKKVLTRAKHLRVRNPRMRGNQLKLL